MSSCCYCIEALRSCAYWRCRLKEGDAYFKGRGIIDMEFQDL